MAWYSGRGGRDWNSEDIEGMVSRSVNANGSASSVERSNSWKTVLDFTFSLPRILYREREWARGKKQEAIFKGQKPTELHASSSVDVCRWESAVLTGVCERSKVGTEAGSTVLTSCWSKVMKRAICVVAPTESCVLHRLSDVFPKSRPLCRHPCLCHLCRRRNATGQIRTRSELALLWRKVELTTLFFNGGEWRQHTDEKTWVDRSR